jgi:membrane fusion protein, type I secretion system
VSPSAVPYQGDLSIGGHIRLGLAVVVLLLGGMGSWAATSKLAGAVIAAGTLVVENNVKKVQHPTGGIVKELRVKEGDTIAAGDLLILLDATQAQATLGIIQGGLDELKARKPVWRGKAKERKVWFFRQSSWRGHRSRI